MMARLLKTVIIYIPHQSPVPASETACGEPTALSVKLTEAFNVPMPVGLKTIESTQLAPGAKVLPQLLVWENDAGLVPVILTP